MNRTAILALALILAAPVGSAPAWAAPSPDQVAAAALKAAPVWDGHNDVPEQLRERIGYMIEDFDFRDTRATARDGKAADRKSVV